MMGFSWSFSCVVVVSVADEDKTVKDSKMLCVGCNVSFGAPGGRWTAQAFKWQKSEAQKSGKRHSYGGPLTQKLSLGSVGIDPR